MILTFKTLKNEKWVVRFGGFNKFDRFSPLARRQIRTFFLVSTCIIDV